MAVSSSQEQENRIIALQTAAGLARATIDAGSEDQDIDDQVVGAATKFAKFLNGE